MKNNRSIRMFFAFLVIALAILACDRILGTPSAPTPQPATQSATVTPQGTPVPEGPVDPNAGSAGLGDSLYPGFGNGGYDAVHYQLDITVTDVATSNLLAVTTLDAKATQDLHSFNLDFIGFEITGITVNGQAADFDRTGQELTVTPAQPIMTGDEFTVVVEYNGPPGHMQSVALPFQTGWVTIEGGSFVLSEPDGAASFFPSNDHPLDKATYTFLVTVPKPYEVAANGVLTETTDHGDARTFAFEERAPMASYLATINIDELDEETMKSRNGIPIRNYYSTGLPEDVRKPFARQGEMLDYFGGVFGPYPFEVYGAFVMDTQFGAALENQTMSIFGMDMINLQDVAGTELVVAHELAHQWFGDSVSVADWGDIWLNEGFADYSEGLWIEHISGRRALDAWVKSQYTEVLQYPQYYPPPGNPPADNLFNGGVYLRGGLTLHALRLEVGDQTFFKLLQTYYARYRGGNASTGDFISVAEEMSGKELTNFLEDWLYSEKLPPIPALDLGD
ncbi:MAG: M1 family metallopeptidase [Chloroflexi bacterium]|nr:M1 family metallopeptidase [Chloroflexota bacterium]